MIYLIVRCHRVTLSPSHPLTLLQFTVSSLAHPITGDDVFAIDAALESPQVVDRISNVGTVLFDLAVQPGSGEVWVSNTEALNFVPHEPRLRGKFARNRVTRIALAGNAAPEVQAVELNPHIARSGDGGSLRHADRQPRAARRRPPAARPHVAGGADVHPSATRRHARR